MWFKRASDLVDITKDAWTKIAIAHCFVSVRVLG